ncbi:hypothetical protein IWW57_004725 [Coemansia sp. S610]|nr:hypothetical protein IWW57_004725 [Coemansia sp. S610]
MAGGGSIAVTSPTSENARETRGWTEKELSADERERLVNQAEWGFRKWLTENSRSGYVMYPSTRQILKSLQTLYKTLEEIDFSDIT